jgi:hypothetical protein
VLCLRLMTTGVSDCWSHFLMMMLNIYKEGSISSCIFLMAGKVEYLMPVKPVVLLLEHGRSCTIY